MFVWVIHLDTFLVARQKGYRGITSKNCKGFYKSVINAASCLRWSTAATPTASAYWLKRSGMLPYLAN